MINKIKMIFLVAVLAFCHLDAVPIQIFDYRGEPIAGEAGMLPDEAILLARRNLEENQENDAANLLIEAANRLIDADNLLIRGIYYLRNGNFIRVNDNNLPTEGDAMFFIVNPAAANPLDRTYVAIDSLENQAVRNKFREVNINNNLAAIIIQRLNNMKLCAALCDERWGNSTIKRLRDIGWGRKDVIKAAFEMLKQSSNQSYIEFIKRIRIFVIQAMRDNININNDYIINRYMTLRICFHRDRANGNANTAIRHLLIDPTDLFLPEEKAVMNRFRDDYFIPHITKHFCYSGLIDSHFNDFPLNQFPDDIAHPEPKLHTTLSYDMGNNNTFQTAGEIAENVYPMILNMLLARCRFAFRIEGLRFTIEPNLGNGLKVEGGYVSFGKIGNHMRNFDYNGVIPIIFIRDRKDNGKIENNPAKENEKFSIFFNIGANLAENNATLKVDGTLFPSVN